MFKSLFHLLPASSSLWARVALIKYSLLLQGLLPHLSRNQHCTDTPWDCSAEVNSSPFCFFSPAVEIKIQRTWNLGSADRTAPSQSPPSSTEHHSEAPAWPWLAPVLGLFSSHHPRNALSVWGEAWSPTALPHPERSVTGQSGDMAAPSSQQSPTLRSGGSSDPRVSLHSLLRGWFWGEGLGCVVGTKIGEREADNTDAKFAGTKLGLILHLLGLPCSEEEKL